MEIKNVLSVWQSLDFKDKSPLCLNVLVVETPASNSRSWTTLI